MIKLVTGSTGTAHVTSADDGALHAAMAGDGLIVFDIGSKFSATLVSATVVRIGDGEGLIDGRHFRISPGTNQELSMSDGTSGYNRNDLVVLHYKNSAGKESLTLEVLEGSFTSGDAIDPSYTGEDSSILEGASELYVPLYRLSRSGISLPIITQLFEPKSGKLLEAVAAAKATAEKGVSDAAAAKATADKGVSAAASAQTQADKGVSDAAAALAEAKKKIPTVSGATEGHVAVFDANGNIKSSGKSFTNFTRATMSLSGTTLTITTVD